VVPPSPLPQLAQQPSTSFPRPAIDGSPTGYTALPQDPQAAAPQNPARLPSCAPSIIRLQSYDAPLVPSQDPLAPAPAPARQPPPVPARRPPPPPAAAEARAPRAAAAAPGALAAAVAMELVVGVEEPAAAAPAASSRGRSQPAEAQQAGSPGGAVTPEMVATYKQAKAADEMGSPPPPPPPSEPPPAAVTAAAAWVERQLLASDEEEQSVERAGHPVLGRRPLPVRPPGAS